MPRPDIISKRRFTLIFSIVAFLCFTIGIGLFTVGLFGGLDDYPLLYSTGRLMAVVGTILQLVSLLHSAMAPDFGVKRPTFDPYTYDTVGLRRKLFPGEKHD